MSFFQYKYDIRNPEVEGYRLLYIWVESGRGGGRPDAVFVLGGEVPNLFLGHYIHGILYVSLESSAQAQSIASLFERTG